MRCITDKAYHKSAFQIGRRFILPVQDMSKLNQERQHFQLLPGTTVPLFMTPIFFVFFNSTAVPRSPLCLTIHIGKA